MNSEQGNRPDNEVLVRVEGVSKKFCRSLKRSLWYGLCDIGAELNPFRRQVAEVAGCGLRVVGNGSRPDSSEFATSNSPPVTDEAGLRPGEFWAVNNVSFQLHRGECLGLIGHNGAGKTTLLKMLNGLIKPDRGRIEMNGRIGALIALGAGFNPILTGRENIYINGSVLGLSKKEIDEKIDEIIDFAEIGEFIDMPVQNYSSGMTVRLGFAVATALDPDVLILDEVLAVGDAAFRAKCYNRIGQLQQKAAVIFVSHSMDQVAQVCTRVCGMHRGHAQLFPDKDSGVRWYQEHSLRLAEGNEGMEYLADSIASFTCPDLAPTVVYGESLVLTVGLHSLEEVSSVVARVVIYSSEGVIVAEWNSANGKTKTIKLRAGGNTFRFSIGPLYLKWGDYSLGILLQNEETRGNLVWSHQRHRLFVDGPSIGTPCYVLP